MMRLVQLNQSEFALDRDELIAILDQALAMQGGGSR